jgi:uncharacterized membrane protein
MSRRNDILGWAEDRRLRAADVLPALRLAGILPTAGGWRRFLDRLTLWLAVVLLCAAVIMFFAYNWQAMGRYAKFGLVEALFVVAVLAAWRFGPDRIVGQAALLGAAILVGALLALIGQVYETGADPWELFAVWAIAILPWVAILRFAPLWLFWVALVNLAAILYHQAFGGLIGVLFGTERLLWVLLGLNTVALVAWEFLALRGIEWLQPRWAPRVLATASGGLATALAVWAVFEFRTVGVAGALAYGAWLGGAYVFYRYRMRDVFVLAGGVLSGIIVVASVLSRVLLDLGGAEAGAFLLIGLAVIGLSAAGGFWLRRVAQEGL